MGKRKVEQPTSESEAPPASSEQFSSLVSKYSFSLSAVDEPETRPSSSIPVTPPETPQRKKPKASRVSHSNSRNPSYAPPSAYSHLPTPDLDALAHGLALLFVGLNPGTESLSIDLLQVWRLLLLSMLSLARQTSSGHYSIPQVLRPYGIPSRLTSRCPNFIVWVLQT